MSDMVVHHHAGDRFSITIRNHEVLVDQPLPAGGTDAGPTPTELFVAGLASCVAFFARRFMARHGLDTDGLAVTAGYRMSADRPARVAEIRLKVITTMPIPEHRRAAFERVVEHCTVHNSMRVPPEVEIVHETRPHPALSPVVTASGVEPPVSAQPTGVG